ncbi:MAG: Dabb family protein [Pirellulales bacterium]
MSCCSSSRGFYPFIVGALIIAGTWIGVAAAFPNAENEKVLRHVVLVKFKETSSKEDQAKVLEGFRKLPSQISEVAAFEHGTDNSPEGLANGFTHCFLFTFKTEKDRDAYLPHPAHQKFVDMALPHIEKVLVVDYLTNP